MTFIISEGDLYTFKDNRSERLELSEAAIPCQTCFKFVFCGYNHKMAIDIEGNLWACGENQHGQLGMGDTINYQKLTKVPTCDIIFISVSCGDSHTVGLDIDGNLWSCGNNFDGQLGLHDNEKRNIFTKILSETSFKYVSCGYSHTFALDINDNLWSCGTNFCRQLGTIYTLKVDMFTKVICNQGSPRFKSVSCGNAHTMALDIVGNLWSCGNNFFGQLGFNNNSGHIDVLTKIPSETTFISVSSGYYHSIALDIDGNIWSCGSNFRGQLGLGTNIPNHELIKIPCDAIFMSAACVACNTIAVDIDGNLWSCGENLCNNTMTKVPFDFHIDVLSNIHLEKSNKIKGAHTIRNE